MLIVKLFIIRVWSSMWFRPRKTNEYEWWYENVEDEWLVCYSDLQKRISWLILDGRFWPNCDKIPHCASQNVIIILKAFEWIQRFQEFLISSYKLLVFQLWCKVHYLWNVKISKISSINWNTISILFITISPDVFM